MAFFMVYFSLNVVIFRYQLKEEPAQDLLAPTVVCPMLPHPYLRLRQGLYSSHFQDLKGGRQNSPLQTYL